VASEQIRVDISRFRELQNLVTTLSRSRCTAKEVSPHVVLKRSYKYDARDGKIVTFNMSLIFLHPHSFRL